MAPDAASTTPGTVDPSDGIVFYGADWCSDSRRSRRLLDRLGIDYRFVDLDGDDNASAWVRANARGHRTTPTIVLKQDIIVIEPTDDQLLTALRAAKLIEETAA